MKSSRIYTLVIAFTLSMISYNSIASGKTKDKKKAKVAQKKLMKNKTMGTAETAAYNRQLRNAYYMIKHYMDKAKAESNLLGENSRPNTNKSKDK